MKPGFGVGQDWSCKYTVPRSHLNHMTSHDYAPRSRIPIEIVCIGQTMNALRILHYETDQP